MQYTLFSLLLFSTLLFAQETTENSSVEIPVKECMKIRYAHTLGGTLHSRKTLNKRAVTKLEASLPHTREEAQKLLQQKYPHLHIDRISLIIRKCKGYYLYKKGKKEYLFDPKTLTLINKNGVTK